MSQVKFRNLIFIIFIIAADVLSQPTHTQVIGRVVDPRGVAVRASQVSLIDSKQMKITIFTDETGSFAFRNIPAGIFKLEVRKQGFSLFEINDLRIDGNTKKSLNITLGIKIEDSTVEVSDDPNKPDVSDNDSIVLKEKELEKLLPEDPDEIARYLKLLAGDSGGPDGATIYVDGFLATRVPAKSSIGEVRIDNNPYSAEYEKIGSGVINIFTKISSRQFSASLNASFNDESLNARNPFAMRRPASQYRVYGGRVGGTFFKKRASYSLNIAKRDFDEQKTVNADIVDQDFNIGHLRQNQPVPVRRFNLTANTDFQLGNDKTLRLGYEFYRDSRKNAGVGGQYLLSTGNRSSSGDTIVRVSQTSVIKDKIINEIRFQFQRVQSKTDPLTTEPRIVTDTFVSGNSSVGAREQTNATLEINNVLTFEVKRLTFRAGGGIRLRKISDHAPNNFRGTFVYNGGNAPKLINNILVTDGTGRQVTETISGIERFRRTILFISQGRSKEEIRVLGGGASQFSINYGDPAIKIRQVEANSFVYTSWRMRSNLNLGAGVRFDSQTNLPKNFDFSPRLAIAWSPFEKGNSTIIRAGIGRYSDRIPLNLRLQPERIGLGKIQSFLTSDPATIDNLGDLTNFAEIGISPDSLLQMTFSPRLKAAYYLQSAISLEQELPHKLRVSLTFTENNGRQLLRSRNVGDYSQSNMGNIYQIESTAVFNSHTLSTRLSKQFKKYSIFINYRLGSSKSDTDGPQTFPANPFSLSDEYGPTLFDSKQNLYFGGFLNLPFKFTVSPSISIRSGTPFNITLGYDLNRDSIYTDRPGLAEGKTGPGIVSTAFGQFDQHPTEASKIIPRNFGRGQAYIGFDLDINRDFVLFKTKGGTRQITANLSAQIINILNTANFANPVGTLSSPFFGKSISDNSQGIFSGARTVTFHLRLSF